MFRAIDPDIRIALMQATQERQELGHERLGTDHLLLGLLTNVRSSAYQVFADHGVDYAAARTIVEQQHDDSDDAADEQATPADTSSSLDDDREALRAIGIDLDKVRAAVRTTFGEDIAERWGERRGRGPRGPRGPRPPHGPHGGPGHDGHDGHGHGRPGHRPDGPEFGPQFGPDRADDDFEGFGPWGPPGRGRRGPRSRRFFGQVTPSLRTVMQDLTGEYRAEVRDRHGSGRPPQFAAARLLAALVDSGDPAVEAIVASADDPAALRAQIRELAAHTAV